MQARIFASQDFTKLADKYAEHADEERGYVKKCADRILDLGGTLKLGDKKDAPLHGRNRVLKYDLQVLKDGLAWLAGLVEEARSDYTTFDILKEYYQDKGQLELIKLIGKENWYIQQL